MRKKNIETPKADTQNTEALIRTSSYSEERENHLDAEGEQYIYLKRSSNRKQRDTYEHIMLGQVYDNPDGTQVVIDKEILIVLDGIDHEEDIKNETEERYRDKVSVDNLVRSESSDSTGKDAQNPWNKVETPNTDPFTLLFPDEAPRDEKVEKILAFMETLTDTQRDLIYDHLGAWKYLEDIRRAEIAKGKKEITQQAVSNRWDKIITRGCKYFGVEKPRKRKK